MTGEAPLGLGGRSGREQEFWRTKHLGVLKQWGVCSRQREPRSRGTEGTLP